MSDIHYAKMLATRTSRSERPRLVHHVVELARSVAVLGGIVFLLVPEFFQFLADTDKLCLVRI